MIKIECVQIIEGLLEKDKNRLLHFSLFNRRWYNGKVVDVRDDELLKIDEKELNLITIPYSKIINIEPMKNANRY